MLQAQISTNMLQADIMTDRQTDRDRHTERKAERERDRGERGICLDEKVEWL